MPEIPREALDISYTNIGFLPHIGLHRRSDLFLQESSYSHFWLLGAMLAAALTVLFLPWRTLADLDNKLKYFIAFACLFAGICGVIPYFIRNAWGQTITINPKNRTLFISSTGFTRRIFWDQIIGLQICHQRVSRFSEKNGYQLNLVWVEADGKVKRHCLLKHVIKSFVVRLGRRYESLFAFRLIDDTGRLP